MAVTIYDLAREAGVGIGTVSRCMNNHPSVAPGTRQRVLSIAKRLSYVPHAHAQRLASKKTNTIAMIIPYFTNYFFVKILEGVQDRASESGFDLILYGVNNPLQADEYLRKSLRRGHVDGVLFFSMRFPEAYVSKFIEIRLPLVLVDAFHPRFDSISVENRQGAVLAVRHLIRLGHRSIAMINASPDAAPARERMEGYRLALEEAGIPFYPSRVVVPERGRQDGFHRDTGRAGMLRILDSMRRRDRVTAVLVASDVQALGAMEAAREGGVRIPEDLAMVGFDDIDLAAQARLTTMRQPMYEMGMLALERLMGRLREPDAPPRADSFVPELVVRHTCGAQDGAEAPSRPARNLSLGKSA
ncbi:MAG: LacI family DNA-binding transcriptional regulator [Bacteroidota bacterium]